MKISIPLRSQLVSASDITADIVVLTASASISPDFDLDSDGIASLQPSDLNVTNRVVAGVMDLLEESLDSDEDTADLSNSVRNE